MDKNSLYTPFISTWTELPYLDSSFESNTANFLNLTVPKDGTYNVDGVNHVHKKGDTIKIDLAAKTIEVCTGDVKIVEFRKISML